MIEKTLWRGRPSHYYYLGSYILGGVLCLAYGLGLLLVLCAIIDRYRHKYYITNQHIGTETGLIARNTIEVRIGDVRSVNMKQGVFERLFKVGTIKIAAAGTDKYEVVLKGISKPEKIKNGVTRLIQQQRGRK